MDDPILGIIVTVLLVAANAFFVAAEFAIVKVRSSQIELRAQSGERAAKMAQRLITHLDEYLSATQLGITLASLGLGWVGEPIVSKLLIGTMHLVGIAPSDELAHRIALPVAFVVITALHIIFGELAPKSFAIQRSEGTSLAIAFPLRGFYILFRPAIMFLNWVATAVLKTVGLQAASEADHYHSGEELRLLLEQGLEGGTIEEAEHELIENVFEFGDTIVKEVMVPRTAIVALDISKPSSELVKFVVEEGYTRMPVYSGSIDHIIGVVYSKDFITLLEHQNLIILQDVLRPAYFVPETKLISELLREFQRNKVQIAIVVDEFGGTAGLVTMEDILEELVGEIQDEYDEEPAEVERVEEGCYIVDASMSIPDLNDAIEGFALPEGDDYTTVGGLVNKWFGRIPSANESLERDSVRMTVLKTADRRIIQVKLEDLNRNQPDNGLNAFADEDAVESGE
ncbi:MAG TPA: hemolysin family protein [Candidatus Kapabacteria bacterium]|nr:hemolysin family protein [Candidatus Kapabacteria bacterium]